MKGLEIDPRRTLEGNGATLSQGRKEQSDQTPKRKYQIIFVTVVPSPYQRDLFRAMAAREELDLSVYYMEGGSPDSPWPPHALRPFERIMRGFWLRLGDVRWHFNWPLPDCSKADVVVLSSFSSWAGQWLMRRPSSRKCLLYWGERLRPQKSGFRDLIQRILTAPLKRVNGIVGIGRQAQTDYAHRFPRAVHFCLPYHCDLSGFLRIPGRDPSEHPFRFLFCGQIIRRKGVDLLLKAFENLTARGFDSRLLLVGREADLPEFMASLGPAARSRIHYEGFQPPERLPEYFSKADAFVLPSRHDGWGVVVNQALAAGLPIIASDAVGAGLDLVEHGVNGLLFRTGNVRDLQECMERLAFNPEKTRALGEASRLKALSLTPERGAEKWVQIFEELKAIYD